jgi:hypothetical protein
MLAIDADAVGMKKRLGRAVSLETPCPYGPRHSGQLSASSDEDAARKPATPSKHAR